MWRALPPRSKAVLPVALGESAAPDKRSLSDAAGLRPAGLGSNGVNLRRLKTDAGFDVAVVVSDGLSAQAVNTHAASVVTRIVSAMRDTGLTLAPIAILQRGVSRLAIASRTFIGARCVIVLIGERPGLSAPDSLGAYLTYARMRKRPTPIATASRHPARRGRL